VTVPPPAARSIWLRASPDAVFGTFHDAASGPDSATAVLIVGPWGWDEITSYASRRAWAEHLAADGHPTLRIDLPGIGDSAGTPSDPARLDAWTSAIGAAAAWLAARPGVDRVALIGLGLGGLVAGKAIADGAPVDDLVLWAAPSRGRAFLREQRAFAALQSDRYSVSGEPEPTVLPDGWLEVGGFVLAAETIAAIAPLELDQLPLGRLQRALLLQREGLARDAALEAHLAEAGVDVTAAPGPGWTDMVFHPEQYTPPAEVFDRVGRWLAGAPVGRPRPVAVEAPEALDRLELCLDGRPIRETPVHIAQPFGQLFGLLAEPVDAPATPLCAVFLNAGAVRRVGPNRLWTEIARDWTRRGVPTFRVDLEGIGDSDGDPRRYRDVANFYTPAYGAEVGAILDDLQARGLGPRFVLIGLCAGAYWAVNTAATDGRVIAALVVNPGAMVWDAGLLQRREAAKIGRLLQPSVWRRVARGELGASRMVAVSRAVAERAIKAAVRAPRRLTAAARSDATGPATARLMDALRDRGTRVVLGFSGDEPVYDELRSEGILARMDEWPNAVLETLPGRDHTVRPIVAQRAVRAMLGRELERLSIDG
jgi:alpha-beta hydrolase superfamily lysophospholipase